MNDVEYLKSLKPYKDNDYFRAVMDRRVMVYQMRKDGHSFDMIAQHIPRLRSRDCDKEYTTEHMSKSKARRIYLWCVAALAAR